MEREMEKGRVVRVRHRQAELGAGLIFLCELESSLSSLTPSWSIMTLSCSAVTVGQFE